MRQRRSPVYPDAQPSYDTDGNPRELEQLLALRDVDCLLSPFLGTNRYAKIVRTNLIAGHYIGVIRGNGKNEDDYGLSEDARNYAKKRNVYLPLALWPRGEALLKRRGLWTERIRQSDHFDHKVFRCCVEQSWIIGAKELGAELGGIEEILAHPNCPPDTREDEHPNRIPLGKEKIIPDFTRRISLEDNFWAHCEIDNGTETLTGTKRDTIETKVRRYARYLRERGFKKRYGLPKITILFYFNQKSRLQAFLKIVSKIPEEDVRMRFAAMYVPNFRNEYPPRTGYAVTEPYERCGDALNIMEVIRGRKTGKDRGTTSSQEEDRPRA